MELKNTVLPNKQKNLKNFIDNIGNRGEVKEPNIDIMGTIISFILVLIGTGIIAFISLCIIALILYFVGELFIQRNFFETKLYGSICFYGTCISAIITFIVGLKLTSIFENIFNTRKALEDFNLSKPEFVRLEEERVKNTELAKKAINNYNIKKLNAEIYFNNIMLIHLKDMMILPQDLWNYKDICELIYIFELKKTKNIPYNFYKERVKIYWPINTDSYDSQMLNSINSIKDIDSLIQAYYKIISTCKDVQNKMKIADDIADLKAEQETIELLAKKESEKQRLIDEYDDYKTKDFIDDVLLTDIALNSSSYEEYLADPAVMIINNERQAKTNKFQEDIKELDYKYGKD